MMSQIKTRKTIFQLTFPKKVFLIFGSNWFPVLLFSFGKSEVKSVIKIINLDVQIPFFFVQLYLLKALTKVLKYFTLVGS